VTLIGLETHRPVPAGRVRTVALPERSGADKLGLLRKMLAAAHAERADAYHCCDPWAFAVGLMIQRSRRNVRLIYDSTEHFPYVYADRTDLAWPFRAATRVAVSYLEYMAVRRADIIIETNRTRAERFVRAGRKPVIVPNYPPKDSVPSPGAVRMPWIAYTGLISRHRGFDRLLQAFASAADELPEVRLRVAGEFDRTGDLKSWTDGFVTAHRLDDRVDFLGWLPYADMFAELARCQVGVILLQAARGNDYTGQPNKLFEFMAAGLVVIASDFPEMAGIVRKELCGHLVEPNSVESISAGLRKSFSAPATARNMGERGRRAVEREYNWRTAEHELLNAYRELAG
jgi:glycosyltransferase involved in cell wall biosynthesis